MRLFIPTDPDFIWETCEKCVFIFTTELRRMGWDFNTGFMPYGERWRFSRGVIHQWFRSAAIPQYSAIQRGATAVFLQSLLDEPKNFYHSIRRCVLV